MLMYSLCLVPDVVSRRAAELSIALVLCCVPTLLNQSPGGAAGTQTGPGAVVKRRADSQGSSGGGPHRPQEEPPIRPNLDP
jgi:hypothetical protein